MLEEMVVMVRATVPYEIVEAAHMELAEPSIATAFDACVARGAAHGGGLPVLPVPGQALAPGHPRARRGGRLRHPGVTYLVAAPFGLHPLMAEVVDSRVERCLAHVRGEAPECEACAGTGTCRMVTSAETTPIG